MGDKGLSSSLSNNTYVRVGKYLLVRLLAVSLTIVIGVFIVVIIANKRSQLDQRISRRVETEARQEFMFAEDTDENRAALEQLIRQKEEDAGLNLPYFQRHLRFTYNALTLEWGIVHDLQFSGIYRVKTDLMEVKEIVLDRFPNTLLLVGAADLIIFVVGIPLALTLSRKQGKFVDRIFSFLAPLSSIPSWVYGVFLVLVFAFQLRFLPFGGMFDSSPPVQKVQYIPIVLRHMVLPVAAILLSLLFQLVYTWRTYFLIYSDEDYVELARAKGLTMKEVGRKHIMRPTSPFIITTFSLTLVGFWQMTTALEVVFNWPGIGQLYIQSLPHFWGESMFPGELPLSIAIVVIFAYLLAVMVLVLDVVYAWVDPRVRIMTEGVSAAKSRRPKVKFWDSQSKGQIKPEHISRATSGHGTFSMDSIRENAASFIQKTREVMRNIIEILRELVHYPSAAVSLVIILVLIIGSIYALVALPYSEIGSRWYTESMQGNAYVPKYAQPEWMNNFREGDLLSTIIQSSQDGTAQKAVEWDSNDMGNVLITYRFDYDYEQIPDEMYLNFDTEFVEKRPFVVMTWVTPDHREIELKALSIEADKRVDLIDYLPNSKAQANYFNMANMRDETTEMAVLFTDPESDTLEPVQGTYELRVDSRLFEEGSDIDAELVLLGQVYGFAGTDYMRRDLFVPLLWGMPFALIIGLAGAVLTTIVSMLVAAAGVWYGGWVDGLVQRITEVNMIFPILAIGVLFYAFFHVSLWTIIAVILILNIFGSPTKAFRSAFLQVKQAPYMEAAQAYGASNWRLIWKYMVPRIMPVMIPQLISLVPAFVFLEATLGMFNIHSTLPTWGRVIYEALNHGITYGSRFWVLQPLALLLLTGFAFAFLGFALDKILNPRLKGV